MLSLLGLLGIGGFFGGAIALYFQGQRISARITELRVKFEQALKTPTNADFPALVEEFKEFERDTKRFFANFRKVIGR